MAGADTSLAIRVRDLEVGFARATVLDGVSLDCRRGEILGLVGASGSGKSVLLRAILGLVPRRKGHVEVLGRDMDEGASDNAGRGWGVLFQQGALFSALTVRQNVEFPMREHLDLSERLMREVAMAKLELVGLRPEDAGKLPAELSGGMIKRAALARALALDPEIVFLDEPTSGLDPVAAGAFDNLIRTLQDTLRLTVFLVTHDLNSVTRICDRVAVLARGRVVAIGSLEDVLASDDPFVRSFFGAQAARSLRVESGRSS
jgi:phospholipid/cholesterol/gamma-HCH transport system ATP-binding protein